MLCFVGEQEANVFLYKIARVRRLIRSLVVLIELLCLDKACKQAIVFAKHYLRKQTSPLPPKYIIEDRTMIFF